MDKGYNKAANYYGQNTDPSDFLLFQYKRTLTFLFKSFLLELEELEEEGLISEEYFKKRRKEILDMANNFFRDFEDVLLKFDIRHKGKYENNF